MREKLKIRLILIFLLLAAALIIALLPSFKNTARAAAGSYAYDNGSMQIDVDENKVMHIKENLKVAFLDEKTYFERRVAGKAKSVKNAKGKAKKGRSFLAEITVLGAKIEGKDCEFSVARNGTNNYIRLEKDGTFKKWNEDDRPFYNIQLEYICDLSQDEDGKSALGFYFFEEVDMRWFNYKNGERSKLDVTVNMPKDFDADRVSVVLDGSNISGQSGLAVDGNTISFSAEYKNIDKCRITALLPDGYFTTRATRFSMYWYFVGAVGLLALAGLIVTFIFRKRRPVAPVEIAPPILNTMVFSAHWHGIARRKDLCTLLLQWADRGCIKIKKDGKRDVIITKIKNLPKSASVGEVGYFNALFDGGNIYSSRDIRGSAGRRRRHRIMYAAGKLIEEIGEPVTYARGVLGGRITVMFLSLLAPLICFLYCIIIADDYPFMLAIGFMAAVVAMTFFAAYKFLNRLRIQRRAYSLVYKGTLLLATPIFIPAAAMVWIMLTAQYMILYDYIYLLFISLGWIAVSVYLLPRLIEKRAEESQKLYGRMVGFKNFLRLAKVKEIETMIDENPDYYLDVLPYCMIMGLSRKLDKKTEFLKAPDWAEGFDAKRFAASFFSTIKRSVVTRKRKTQD
ncbi:MAG: DUF2207 domain-containing protein [Clostridia bacterium]|nr:DUF2207 domain-containing protein [Clostridia bacterium]